MEGKLVIISAPSGAGKTTIVRHLLDRRPGSGVFGECYHKADEEE